MPTGRRTGSRRGHSHQSGPAAGRGGFDSVRELRSASRREAAAVGLKLVRMAFVRRDGTVPGMAIERSHPWCGVLAAWFSKTVSSW